jgi:hypothetical protein
MFRFSPWTSGVDRTRSDPRYGEVFMSTQENVQIVKDFFAAMGAYNKQDLLALVAEDIEWIIPGEDWPLAPGDPRQPTHCWPARDTRGGPSHERFGHRYRRNAGEGTGRWPQAAGGVSLRAGNDPLSFANLSSGSGREVDRGWIGNATGVIACERAHVGPEIASGRTRLRRSGRGLAIYVDVGMADVCEDLRRRGARSGDAGHRLRVAPRSLPCLAAGRPLAPVRPCPKIGEFWTCGSR